MCPHVHQLTDLFFKKTKKPSHLRLGNQIMNNIIKV